MNSDTSTALFVLLAAAVGIVMLIFIIPVRAYAIECREQPGDKSYWSYRLIESQRCWYRGHRVIPKSRLHWPEEKPKRERRDPVFHIRAEEKPTPPRVEAPLRSDQPMNVVTDGCCWPVLTEFDLRWAGVQ